MSCSANNLRSWAKRRRSPRRTREPDEGYSWDEVSIWARCSVQYDKGLTRPLKTVGADESRMIVGSGSVARNPFVVIALEKTGHDGSFRIFCGF